MNVNMNPEMSEKTENDNRKVEMATSMETLLGYRQGTVVELPPFAEGQPFYARIRRPSMFAMIKSGKIPNQLLSTATKLFEGKSNAIPEDKAMDEIFGVLDVLCESSFVEPTYTELKDNGIELSDDQYMFIFNYTQRGVKALENFRR